MSDYARFKNIEPMYKAKIKAQDELIGALREKIRILENRDNNWDVKTDMDEIIEQHTKIFDAEIVEDEETKWIGPGHDPSGNEYP